MTALNKQALREAAQEEIMLRSVSDTSDAWQDEASPEAVLALLDELEAAEKRISELEARAFNPAILDVVAERQRQVSAEGWTPAHDDQHRNNDMAFAAACYAFHAAAASWDLEDGGVPYDSHPVPKNWPWEPDWWKPTDPMPRPS